MTSSCRVTWNKVVYMQCLSRRGILVYLEYPTRNLIFSGTHSSLYTKKNKVMIARWIFHGIPREDYERAFDNLSSHPKFN